MLGSGGNYRVWRLTGDEAENARTLSQQEDFEVIGFDCTVETELGKCKAGERPTGSLLL